MVLRGRVGGRSGSGGLEGGKALVRLTLSSYEANPAGSSPKGSSFQGGAENG